MSNSQPCHGHLMNSPDRLTSNSPARRAHTRWVMRPRHSSALWCGQRLRSAKYSPARLKMPIWRPFTCRTSGVPGTTSPTRATTCFSGLRKAVELLGVGREDAGLGSLVERILEGVAGVVHVPVRIVGGEQQPVRPDPSDHVADMARHLQLLHRLGGVPDIAAHVLGRRALHVGRLAAMARTDLVATTDEARLPG